MKNSKDDKTSHKKPRPRNEKMQGPTDVPSLPITRHSGYLSTFILLILTLLVYDLIIASGETIDFEALKTDLKNNVYNQSDVVHVITESLDKIQKQDHIVDIVTFIGSTGVGKTFTANILKKYFLSFTYELRGSKGQENIVNAIKQNSFKYNLIIIDDLTLADVDNLFLFVKSMPHDVTALVVCIFNIQETDNLFNHRINYDHVDKIIRKFSSAEIPHTVAKFHEFTEDQVRGWVIKQLEMKGIDQQSYSKIVQSVVSSRNVKYNGLKGLNSKITLEL